jgi:hypothetical protein
VQIQDVKDMFQEMRDMAKVTFDDLEKCLKKRRRQVESDIQKKEIAAMTSVGQLEASYANLTSHANSLEHVVESSSGTALLGMLGNMKTRLDELDKQLREEVNVDKVKLVVDQGKVSALKRELTQSCKSHRHSVILIGMFESNVLDMFMAFIWVSSSVFMNILYIRYMFMQSDRAKQLQ